MSERPRFARATVVVLGLSALLLADALAAPLGHGLVAGAQAEPTAEPATEAEASAALTPQDSDAEGCALGFGDTDSKVGMVLHGVALTGRGALAVGFSRVGSSDDLGQRRPASVYNASDHWTRVWTASPGAEDGLVAVTNAGRGTAWAVGFTTIRGHTMPLAMRWNGRDWKVSRPKPAGPLTSLFTDVSMVGDNPFAVGYRMLPDGRSVAVAARLAGKRWRYVSPRAGKRESMSLTGVALDGRDGLWVVGHAGPGTEIRPLILRRADASWTRYKPPRLSGEAVLTDVVAAAGNDAWAVGYQRVSGRSLPLVLHWNGRRWARADAPDFDSDEVVLTAVTASPSGGIWTVGAAWNDDLAGHEAVAAWWDGQAWNEVSGIAGGNELHDAAGSLDADGWAVGRLGLQSSTARVCLPPQSGVFGGREPGLPDPTVDDLASSEQGAAAGGAAGAESQPATSDGQATMADGLPASTEGGEEATATEPLAARKDRKKIRRKAGKRSRPARIRTLPAAKPDPQIVARDMARPAGIAEQTPTYGAVVADFDADGHDDLFIGRHGRPGLLALNRSGIFVEHEPMAFPTIDRHGCSAADVDGSGLPDLYCAIGGKRGSGLKSNELWLDPGGPQPVEVAVEQGLSDPTGRGRRAVFLQADGAEDVDLVVTNSPTRVDGLPSLGRLFRTAGDGRFAPRARTGFAARLGSLAVHDADYDDDGREDLLLVTGGPQAPRHRRARGAAPPAARDGVAKVARWPRPEPRFPDPRGGRRAQRFGPQGSQTDDPTITLKGPAWRRRPPPPT